MKGKNGKLNNFQYYSGCKNPKCYQNSNFKQQWLAPQWFISGVVSFGGKKCGDAKLPGVYARVSSHIPWIKKIIRQVRVPDVFQSHCLHNVCLKKTWTNQSSVFSHSSKCIIVIKLSLCPNDCLLGGSFRQKDSLITQVLFELWLIKLLWIVQVFF